MVKQLKKAAIIAGIFLLYAILSSFCFGQEKPAVKEEKTVKTETASIDKKSEEILKKASDFYAAKKNLMVSMTQITKSGAQGQPSENKRDFEVVAEKPNKLSMKSSTNDQVTVIDGKKLFTYRGRAKQYTEKDAPADFDTFMKGGGSAEAFGRFNINMYIVLSMLTNNPYATLTQNIEKIEYKGQEDVAGTKLEHIKIIEKARDIDLWFKSGDNPVIVKIVPDMQKIMRSQGREPRGRIDITVNFDNWKFDEKIPVEKFTFTPGKDDKKVDAFQRGRVSAPSSTSAPTPKPENKEKVTP